MIILKSETLLYVLCKPIQTYQFFRRNGNQEARRILSRLKLVLSSKLENILQQRKEVGQCLAATRLGSAKHVGALQQLGDGQGLNDGGIAKA